MNVTLVEELDDGGAIMQCEMSQEELIALAKIGIIQALKEMIAREPREFVKEIRNEGFYRSVSELDRPVSDS